MAQPQWITKPGSLGTIPEGVFYQVPLFAYDPADPDNPDAVYYKMIAGSLPPGVQCSKTGLIEGIPKAISSLQGVPQEVSRDVTSKFAVRAYTEKIVNGVEVIDRIADQTFTLTVSGQDVPDFVTPPGSIGTFYDGTEISLQIEFTDSDPGDRVDLKLITGSLPPGLVLTRTGLITGVIQPLIGPPDTADGGYDLTPFDQYPFAFVSRSASTNFQFTLELTDGKDSNLRTFSIFVYSRNSMSADTTGITADNTFVTADVIPTRTPVLLTPAGDLGRIRSDNFYAFKFNAVDFDGDPIEYAITVGEGIGFDADGTVYDENGLGFDRGDFALPPGLTIDPTTGWFYGYIPDQGATENTYRFAVRVKKANEPTIISPFYYFTITIIGNVETEVTWLTNPDLGTINNGSVSTFAVEAVNVGGRTLQYRLVSGSNSKLPQGLRLLPSGHIVGKVSFNTFALDGGATTFDTQQNTRLQVDPTTFDMQFDFTVNAYSPQAQTVTYKVVSITMIAGGSGYASNPTVTISPPPSTINAIRATAGFITRSGGTIIDIAVGNPGSGYTSPPIITIEGGGGADAVALAVMEIENTTNPVSVSRRFTITVVRAYDEPYQSLYIKAMPPEQDRALIEQLIQNQDIFPVDLIYRADDPNFGVATSVVYDHAFGLTVSTVDQYAESLNLNHYWKNLTLGEIRTAQALDANGNVLYELVYSTVVDNLVNDQGDSVSKQVTLPYPIDPDTPEEISVVYPNSLINMRNQVIDQIGQVAPILPLWMTSKQTNGRVLGFTPAWVIAYVKPGQSKRVLYNIQQNFGTQLNKVDFKADRYELDRSQVVNWDPANGQWLPSPAVVITFDLLDRPSNINDIGLVDYATTLAFVEINWQTLDQIAIRGGIDGAVTRSAIDGHTVIFQRQEGFGDFTPDQAFTWYDPPFDNGGYSSDLYDESFVIPGEFSLVNQRLSIYTMTVTDTNQVTLEEVELTQVNDSVTIRLGNDFAGEQLYIPSSPVGTLYRNWVPIPADPETQTIFDGGSTRFIAPADQYITTDVFDKYLLYPKTNILGR